MFNNNQHRARLVRAKASPSKDADFLMRHVVDDMIERLSVVKREFEVGLALFGRTGDLAEKMKGSGQIKTVRRMEEGSWNGHPDLIASAPDDLQLEPNSIDIILAPLSLHWAADLPGTLIQAHRALRPDGLMMAVLPGPETLKELRESLLAAESEISSGAAMRVDPFTDIRDAGALLQRAGFALPVVDQDILTVRYDDAFALVRDLRSFAATSRQSATSPALNRQIAVRMAEIYKERFSDPDGRIRASFQLISMSGWVPHESQQKPLKPGSAKARLAEALKTDEKKV